MDLAGAYPRVADGVVINCQPKGAKILRPNPDRTRLPLWDYCKVDLFTSEVLSWCDGTRSYSELLGSMAELYDGNTEAVMAVADSIKQGLESEFLCLLDRPDPTAIVIKGSRAFYTPEHVQFELTDDCNMNCLHCYRNTGPHGKTYVDTGRLVELFDEMAMRGVTVVELTGGEPTLHPDVQMIIQEACKRFGIVALISNGWLIDDDFASQLADKRGLVVQVDLDGDTPEKHDMLRGSIGAFDNAIRAANLLAGNDIRFRLAMNVYNGNADSILPTAQLAHDLGANWFSFSPVIDIGRGSRMKPVSLEQARYIHDLADTLPSQFPEGFIFVSPYSEETDVEGKQINCGAGWRSIAVSPTLEIRPCVMMDCSRFTLGSIQDQSFDTFLSSCQTPFFHDLTLPGDDLCGSCRFLQFCKNCFARPVRAMEIISETKLGITCAWNEATGFLGKLEEFGQGSDSVSRCN